MSPTTLRPQRGGKAANPELKRSRSQGTQRKLLKAQSVASTDDPNFGGGAVSISAPVTVLLPHPCLLLWSRE